MSTVRINELARELEVKSRAILDALTEVGVTEKKTHSSSIEADEAERVRAHILKGRGASGGAARHEAEVKPKIDWSQVHQVGDVARAILEKKQREATGQAAPPPRPTAAAVPPGRPAPPAVVAARPAEAVTPVAAKPAAAPPPAALTASPGTVATASAAGSPAGPEKPAPRRIVPQPRQAPNLVVAAPPQAPQTPAIAAKPPAGPVVAR
ncbi:MAG: translation initiation factor IF-2 N-terminal domain-containing protein, partial [Acidobacteriaceae bacterium]